MIKQIKASEITKKHKVLHDGQYRKIRFIRKTHDDLIHIELCGGSSIDIPLYLRPDRIVEIEEQP